jgi:cytochrome c-type biogenesis protein CcmH
VRRLFFATLLALLAALTHAGEAPPVSANAELEKHVMAISEELRCLVCQNQTIADSNAELAIDLKNQVREKLQQGMSDKEVVDYMVHRYGDFVLYRPPVKATTWLLWFGPFILLLGGVFFLVLRLLRGRAPVEALPDADMQRAAEMLRETTDKEFK